MISKCSHLNDLRSGFNVVPLRGEAEIEIDNTLGECAWEEHFMYRDGRAELLNAALKKISLLQVQLSSECLEKLQLTTCSHRNLPNSKYLEMASAWNCTYLLNN